jgi:hypothetical protein
VPPPAYLDECVRQRLVIPLRARGITITSAREARTSGDDDAAQLAYATQHDLLLITHDTRGFRRLHASYLRQGRPHGGIALVPYGPAPLVEIRVAMLLDWIATFPDRRSRLFRWHDLQQWLIQGNRLPGYSEADVQLALGRSP